MYGSNNNPCTKRKPKMNRLFFYLCILVALTLIQSCASIPKPVMRKDPLIGHIIDTKTSATIDFESLINKICTHDVIYLSEKHDNPEHHHIQKRIIQKLIDKGMTPTLGFEFFSMEDTPDLLNFIDSGKVAYSKKLEKIIETDLRKKLGWDTQSDEMWRYYYDLLTLARKKSLPVAGIDLSTSLKKRITRKGKEDISPLEKELIFSTKISNKAYKDYMFSIFKTVHCGMGNQKMQSRLYDTWVARNDKIALSISQLFKHRKGPVIVIIGAGHTEYGLGVINRVAAIDKTIRQVNLTLREINVTPSTLSEYLSPLELEGFKKAMPAEYLWFTQRVSYVDPCEEFRESLKKMKKHSQD